MRILKSQIDGLNYRQRYRLKHRSLVNLKHAAYERSPARQKKRTEYMRMWRAKNPELSRATIRRSWDKHKDKYRDIRFMKMYGITFSQAEEIKANPCDCCGESDKPRKIDHDHSRKDPHVRGVLCDACNLAIGHIESRKGKLLLDYLRKRGKMI